jgi:hypothetical protein
MPEPWTLHDPLRPGNHDRVEFDAAADELYAVAPAEFTATRKRLAAGLPREEARRLTALRRPTVPAWAVNLLVRDGAIDPLLELGERMRAGWSEGGDVTALDRERSTLVGGLVRRARELADDAGRPLSDAFADEVEETLRAAIADPEAAGAVREGRLDHPLRHAGFGPFAASPSAPPASRTRTPARPKKPRSREEAAKAREEREREERRKREERRRVAEKEAEEAGRALADWEAALDEARQRLAEADERLGELRERLHDSEVERADLGRKAQVAEREHDRAARTAKEARRRARELRQDGS